MDEEVNNVRNPPKTWVKHQKLNSFIFYCCSVFIFEGFFGITYTLKST
jgi:hypothetical protein